MTRDEEQHRIERATAVAEQRISLVAIVVAWALFRTVSPTNPTATYATWLEQALRIGRASALLLVAVAKAGYRLSRALDTGATVSGPGGSVEGTSLGQLRQEFVDAVEDAMLLGSREGLLIDDEDVDYLDSIASDMDDDFRLLLDDLDFEDASRTRDMLLDMIEEESEEYARHSEDVSNMLDLLREWLDEIVNDPSEIHDTPIPVEVDVSEVDDEVFDDIEKMFEDAEKSLEESFKEQFIVEIENLINRRVDDDWSLEKARKAIQEIADHIGLDAAQWLERLARRHSENITDRAAARENRSLLAARKTGPNPCAWCAVIASAGYRYVGRTAAGSTREKTASGEAVDFDSPEWSTGIPGVRRYHAHCKCTVVYRWQEDAKADAVSDELFRLYDENARDLNAFRRALDEIRRERGGSLDLYNNDLYPRRVKDDGDDAPGGFGEDGRLAEAA